MATGAAAWSQTDLAYRKLSRVATLDDVVVVGDFEGYLHWLSADDGSMLARTRVGSGPITSGLKVVDDVVYVQGDDGSMQAIQVPGKS